MVKGGRFRPPPNIRLDNIGGGRGIAIAAVEKCIKIRRIELGLGIGHATVEIELQNLQRLPAEFEIHGRVTVTIVLVPATRNIDATRIDITEPEPPPHRATRAADGECAVLCTKGAIFGLTTDFHRPLRIARNNIDDPGQRIAAPQRALRAAHDLDSLNVTRGEVRKIEFIVLAEIIGFHPVDQHQQMIAFGAPHAHLGLRTGTAIASHRKAGHIAQQFAHILGITTFDFRTRNHGDTTAGEFDWNRHTGRSDHNFFTRVERREGRRIGFGGQHARR